jgi:hypothetical protein
MAFLDTEQIPVNSTAGPGPLFGRIPRGQETLVPLELTAPTEPGIYSLIVVFEESPFLPRGKLVPQPDGGVVIDFLAAITQPAVSNRVFIEVVP